MNWIGHECYFQKVFQRHPIKDLDYENVEEMLSTNEVIWIAGSNNSVTATILSSKKMMVSVEVMKISKWMRMCIKWNWIKKKKKRYKIHNKMKMLKWNDKR